MVIQQEEESATEKEEDGLIEQIMKVLQCKDASLSDLNYQSITYTDGIYLQNISGDQLALILDHLYHKDNP